MISDISSIAAPTPSNDAISKRREELREVAVALEASFLAEMLKHSGFGKARDAFGGGAGEDAFSNLLVQEQADMMAENGGIGMAEHIVTSIMRREGLV